ncbi:hypothetical protein L1987_81212 [Smallanthus sonchifolius]|uniref:Uncharacterized protein n=1 Tax=Smallanthus sonchifolius TaxID=185202 RepID=A0ACB8YPV0_9ASTR|nr:hypothetical protein L1987_81212 [Smallanthus sonchifolius]
MAADNRSLIELPQLSLEGIFTKLPLPSLLVCCCVSKSLLNLIKNDSDFAQTYLAKSEPQLMIQSHLHSSIHLIDLDTDATSRVEVKPSFNPPLHHFHITDSCNGLLLLDSMNLANGVHRCMLYNPVTGEYTLLPETATLHRTCMAAFCYCPKTNQFEVLCMFQRLSPDSDVSSDSFMESDPSSDSDSGSARELIIHSDSDSDSELIILSDLDTNSDLDNTDSDDPEVDSDTDSDSDSDAVYSESDALGEIYVGGSDSWESLGNLPFSPLTLNNSCHLEKAIHWICTDESVPSVIVFFNFGTHEFEEIPGPAHVKKIHVAPHSTATLVVLGNCLSIFDSFSSETKLNVWVMKEYGVKESWSREFVIDTTAWGVNGFHRWFTPVMCRNNGEVVMVCVRGYILYYDLLKKKGRIVNYPPLQCPWFLVLHTPSLMSLRDVARGSNLELEVVNVASRFADPGLNPHNYMELATTFSE